MINNLVLVGRLVRDPELRYTKNQSAVCSFSLALDRPLSREKKEEAKQEGRPTADFPRINVWGKMAESCSKYLQKGSICGVVGRIQTGSYQDKDGKMVYTTDVLAERVKFLDTKPSGPSGGNKTSNVSNINDYKDDDDFFNDDFTEIEDDGRIPF